MKHLNTLLFSATALILSTSLAHADDAVLIEPTWKVGKTYTCDHTQDVTITFGTGEQALENPVNIALTFEAKVAEHGTKGEKSVTVKTTKAKMSMSMFGTTAEYDSEDKAKQSPELAGMIAGILDQGDLKLIFDNKDKFVKFEGGKKVAPAGGGGAMGPMQFGNAEIRQLLAYCVRSFPERPIKKGDKWETEDTVNLNVGAAEMKMDMTAEGPDKEGSPVVTYESKFDVKFPQGGPAAGGAGNGKMIGKMVYDQKNAIISEHVTHIEMTMNMNGIEVPVKQDAKTKLVKVE